MISKLLSKIFGISSKPQAPKTFAQKKRSIFLNRYAGVIYFLVCWHVFGHLIIFGAKDKAKQEGIRHKNVEFKNNRPIFSHHS